MKGVRYSSSSPYPGCIPRCSGVSYLYNGEDGQSRLLHHARPDSRIGRFCLSDLFYRDDFFYYRDSLDRSSLPLICVKRGIRNLCICGFMFLAKRLRDNSPSVANAAGSTGADSIHCGCFIGSLWPRRFLDRGGSFSFGDSIGCKGFYDYRDGLARRGLVNRRSVRDCSSSGLFDGRLLDYGLLFRLSNFLGGVNAGDIFRCRCCRFLNDLMSSDCLT